MKSSIFFKLALLPLGFLMGFVGYNVTHQQKMPPVTSEQQAAALLGPSAIRTNAAIVKIAKGRYVYMAEYHTK
jgi:hypothetical protein